MVLMWFSEQNPGVKFPRKHRGATVGYHGYSRSLDDLIVPRLLLLLSLLLSQTRETVKWLKTLSWFMLICEASRHLTKNIL